MVKVMKIMDLLQKVPCRHCCTQCPQPYSRPPPTHTSTRDSWTHTGTSESVSYGVTAPFFWVLVCTRFFLCPPRVCFPVLCKFLRLYSEVNGDLLQEGYPYPGLLHPEPLPLQQATADPYLRRRRSNTVLSQSLVSPQETDPDLPVCVQETPTETWVNRGLLQGWETECSSACTGSFEGGHHCLHCLHQYGIMY